MCNQVSAGSLRLISCEILESLIDVGRKQQACPAAVAALDRIDDFAMLPWNARPLIGAAAEADAQRPNKIVMTVENRYGLLVLRDAHDMIVKTTIEILKLPVLEFRQHCFLLGKNAFKLVDIGGRNAVGQFDDKEGLQRLADLVHLPQEFFVYPPDACTPVGGQFDQALALKLLKRFANRHRTDAITFREFRDFQPRTRREYAGHDVAANDVAQTLVVRVRQIRGQRHT